MTIASSHNGGRSQINFNFLGSGEYAFLNCLKSAGGWSWADNTNFPVTPDILDANGYPTSIIHGGVYCVFYVPTQASRVGNYVAAWDGNGTIGWGSSNTVLPSATFTGSVSAGVLTAGSPTGGTIQKGMTLSTGGTVGDQLSGTTGGSGTYNLVGGTNASSQSMSVSGGGLISSTGSGRYVFSTIDSRFVFKITALGSPGISNVRVFHVDDEADLIAGNVFGNKFKQRLLEAKFGVLRFLNWQRGNTTCVTTWSTRKPVGYYSYAADEFRQSIYSGVTTNTGNAYSVLAPSGWSGLVDKALVTVVFNASATGAATLNVGGTGDINILNSQCAALTSSTYPTGNNANSRATLMYDSALNAWIKKGGDGSGGGSNGLINACPIELMLQLCAEVGAHPYFVAPPYALTPTTDYMPSLAAYCRDNAPPWMIPRFEGPNELWNTAFGFDQTGYANAIGVAYGWGASDYNNWYGRIISTMGQDIASAYGVSQANVKTQTKYHVICGVQTFSLPASSSNNRLASTKYLLQTPQSGYLASAASNWVTHICCAQYFSPTDDKTGNITTEAAAFAGKAFKASITSGVMNVSVINASNSAAFAVGDTIFGNQVFQPNAGPVPPAITIASLPAALAISSISNANPAVVTVSGTAPASGVPVYISGAATNGMTQLANGWYKAVLPGAGTFKLQLTNGNNVDSTAYGTYSGSGATSQGVDAIVLNSSITVAAINMSAAADLTQPNTFCATCNTGAGSYTLTACNSTYSAWKTWAQGFGVTRMCGYEGGYSPDYVSGGNSLADFLRCGGKQYPFVALFTLQNFNNFIGWTDGSFTVEFPSQFQFSGNPNGNGYSTDTWCILEDIYQPNTPLWDSNRLFNARKRRMIW